MAKGSFGKGTKMSGKGGSPRKNYNRGVQPTRGPVSAPKPSKIKQ